MIIDLFRSEKHKLTPGSHRVSVFKAISWRFIGTIDTMVISYFLTGNLKIAVGIGSIEVISKMLLYYVHERIWGRITKK
jgi:uncharacterized membrane protein